MKVHLVRCASGVELASWQGAGGSRPLSEQGKREAAGLVGFLAGRRIERLIAGPQLRCRETLAPLAAERGLPLHVDDRLDGDAPLESGSCWLSESKTARETPPARCSCRTPGTTVGMAQGAQSKEQVAKKESHKL